MREIFIRWPALAAFVTFVVPSYYKLFVYF